MFDAYEKCLSVSNTITSCIIRTNILPQKALTERGIDKMLKEVREDNKENDAEHMKPVGQASSIKSL